jgi:hypothetical protein
VTDIGWWFTATDGDRPDPVSSHGRSYLIDGTGVIVNIYVPDPMPIDEIEAAVEPLLDAMTFVVADERGDIESDTGS